MATNYALRFVDNGDGTFDIPWVTRYATPQDADNDENGVDVPTKPILRMLAKAYGHLEVNDA